MKMSIIIPTCNEAANIGRLIDYLNANINDQDIEIIVTDAGSTDNTVLIATSSGAKAIRSSGRGRALQMNEAALHATGDILYFVHADCFPPATFTTDISGAIESGFDIGRYISKYDSRKWYLMINAWFTRFDWFICMGGDQTLFITKSLFNRLGGFRKEMLIMEEFEFCERARQIGRYLIISKPALISARKYDTNSWLRVQLANRKIVKMYKRGASQEFMVGEYKKRLHYR